MMSNWALGCIEAAHARMDRCVRRLLPIFSGQTVVALVVPKGPKHPQRTFLGCCSGSFPVGLGKYSTTGSFNNDLAEGHPTYNMSV